MIELFPKNKPKELCPYRVIIHDEDSLEFRGIYDQIDAIDLGWA